MASDGTALADDGYSPLEIGAAYTMMNTFSRITVILFHMIVVFVANTTLGVDHNEHGTRVPKINAVSIQQRPIVARSDTLVLAPWFHIFGDDPDIPVYQWELGEWPNPFSSSPGTIYLVNFIPDTLVIDVCNEKGLPQATIYREVIERGYFRIKIEFDKFVPAGIYNFELTVGRDMQKERMVYIK